MRRVRLTEGQLHRIIRNAVNEAISNDDDNSEFLMKLRANQDKKKRGNEVLRKGEFDPNEDMSYYRDQYDRHSPDADKRGPYDSEEDDYGGFRAWDNQDLYKDLRTKRGQMNYDWDRIKDDEAADREAMENARKHADFVYQNYTRPNIGGHGKNRYLINNDDFL